MAIKTARTVNEDETTENPHPVQAKSQFHTVTDSLGRTIVYKDLGVFDTLQIAKISGAHADNNAVRNIYYIAMSVQTIDGDPGVKMISERTADARVRWVDTEGFRAVSDDWAKNSLDDPSVDDMDTVKN